LVIKLKDAFHCPNADTILLDLLETPVRPKIKLVGDSIIYNGPNGNIIWYYIDNPIHNAKRNIKPGASGMYYATVNTVNGGCYAYSDTIFFAAASTPRIQDKTVKIYPNPTTGNIAIECPEQIHINEIEVYDLSGKCVVHFIVSDQSNITLALGEALSDGIYILSIKTDAFVSNNKILINR
jgi:hypothetical protein